MTLILTAMAAAIVLMVCLLFVFHRDFHAGATGNLGLGLVAVVAASRLLGMLEQGPAHVIPPQATLLWIGLALFLGRQACRFLRRYQTGHGWYSGPRPCAPPVASEHQPAPAVAR